SYRPAHPVGPARCRVLQTARCQLRLPAQPRDRSPGSVRRVLRPCCRAGPGELPVAVQGPLADEASPGELRRSDEIPGSPGSARSRVTAPGGPVIAPVADRAGHGICAAARPRWVLE